REDGDIAAQRHLPGEVLDVGDGGRQLLLLAPDCPRTCEDVTDAVTGRVGLVRGADDDGVAVERDHSGAGAAGRRHDVLLQRPGRAAAYPEVQIAGVIEAADGQRVAAQRYVEVLG